LFNTRDNQSYTIEFRPHSGTTNFTKVKNWLLFCIAFVNFVENYQKEIENEYFETEEGIKKISIPLILESCFGKERSEKLISYFEKRRELFTSEESSKEESKEYSKQKLASIKQLTVKELL